MIYAILAYVALALIVNAKDIYVAFRNAKETS